MNQIFDNLYTLLDKDLKSVIEISNDFYNQLKEDLPTIFSLIEVGHYSDAKKLAHKLKGSSMNFHLPIMTEAFITLENSLESQIYENAIAECHIIEKEMSVFYGQLKQLQ